MSHIKEPVSRRAGLRGADEVLTLPLSGQSTPMSTLPGTPAGSATGKPKTEAATYPGRWHGPKCCLGFHHDLHVVTSDRDIGTRCDPEELAQMLRLTGADFVQTDGKGHPGLTSWFSKTPNASVGPGVVKDALSGWRAATKALGVPLHCHYSGLYDMSAGAQHPEWCMVGPDGTLRSFGEFFKGMASTGGDRMCPRGPYVDELMIPQLLELIDRYDIDGFWVDGDAWGAAPCYCHRCREAFTAQTGIAEPPKAPGEPHWEEWWNFTWDGFEHYVTHYCDAVHRHKPGVVVTSSFLQTLRNPGEPKVPTDWISGDNGGSPGVDFNRVEARFISTRGKPWDMMTWCFYSTHNQLGRIDWVMKPVQMLQQEAAVIVAMGGNFQTNENPFGGVRSGRLVPWRMKRIGELASFVKARNELCQGTDTIPQIAVLYSEHHARSAPGEALWDGIDVTPVQGAVCSLLECHYGVDILDEWALLPRLAQFPIVVVSEQERMSEQMVDALKEYVRAGGRLLIAGTAVFDRFGDTFLGIRASPPTAAIYYLSTADGVIPVSATWRLVETTDAEGLGQLGTTLFPDEQLLPNPAATLNRVGRGAVAYIPCDVFRYFTGNRYPPVRVFIHDVLRALAGRMEIEVAAPTCVDVVLRRQGAKRIVHLINRSSGIPNLPNSVAIDEIPRVGPVTLTMDLPRQPRSVYLAFEEGVVKWGYAGGQTAQQLRIDLATVHIHAALVVEEDV
jgi:hypothetical protein